MRRESGQNITDNISGPCFRLLIERGRNLQRMKKQRRGVLQCGGGFAAIDRREFTGGNPLGDQPLENDEYLFPALGDGIGPQLEHAPESFI